MHIEGKKKSVPRTNVSSKGEEPVLSLGEGEGKESLLVMRKKCQMDILTCLSMFSYVNSFFS